MAYLPVANLWHHKLRSVLSALGIGIGVCMLLTLAGLSRGTLHDVIDRWNGVRADLIVHPASTNLTMASGGALNEQAVRRIAELAGPGGPIAERVSPVYLARLSVGGREGNVFGIEPGDFDVFAAGRPLRSGRLPDADGRFSRWLAGRFEAASGSDAILDIPAVELAEQGGLELAVDTVLARELGKGVGDTLSLAGHDWRIVGVFEAGAVVRVFAPMATLQYLLNGRIDRVTLLFVGLTAGTDAGPAAERIRQATRQGVSPRSEYQALLMRNFGVMYTYIDAVNAVALTIAFLFIMVTLYTMVLQQTRDIAILRSMGAGRGTILRLVLAESVLLTGLGTVMGVAMAYGVAAGIERFRPDLSVTITADWLLTALTAAGAGSLLAGLYPAWRASRVDVAEALTYE